jgi:hypothetical protein
MLGTAFRPSAEISFYSVKGLSDEALQAASAEEKTVPLPNAPPFSVVPKPDEIGSTVGG